MVTPEFSALERTLRKNLEHLQQQLHIAQAGVIVTTQFLKTQDAEQDWDVATLLEQCVGNRLSRQLELTDALLAALDAYIADVAVPDSREWEGLPMQ